MEKWDLFKKFCMLYKLWPQFVNRFRHPSFFSFFFFTHRSPIRMEFTLVINVCIKWQHTQISCDPCNRFRHSIVLFFFNFFYTHSSPIQLEWSLVINVCALNGSPNRFFFFFFPWMTPTLVWYFTFLSSLR